MKSVITTIFIVILTMLIYPSISFAALPTETQDLGAPSCGGEGYCGTTTCVRINEKCPIYQYFADFIDEPQTAIKLDNQKYSSCTIQVKSTDQYGFLSVSSNINVSAQDMASGVYNLPLSPSANAQPAIDAAKKNASVNDQCPTTPVDEATWNKLDGEMKKYGTLCKQKKIKLVCTLKKPTVPVHTTSSTANQAPQQTNPNNQTWPPNYTKEQLLQIAEYLKNKYPNTNADGYKNYIDSIIKWGDKYNVPYVVLMGLLWQESGFSTTAVSLAGAMGMAQFMPGTWPGYAVDADGNGASPWSGPDAIASAAKYLNYINGQVSGGWSAVLAGYNAGPGAVQQFGGIPPYEETQNYVHSISGYIHSVDGFIGKIK